MPASDEFKKALRSGDLPEAFVMAMGRATELNITTKVVKADGTISGSYNPAQQIHTRLDLLNGTIDNEVGEDFLGNSKYRELQEFHQQQVALGNLKIQENFQSLQQLFRLLVTLQQYNRINNAEEPLDLTFLEVPSHSVPAERVISSLREQEEAILATVAGITMPSPVQEVVPEPKVSPEPPPAVVETAVEAEPEAESPPEIVEPVAPVETMIKKVAIAPPIPPLPRRSPPQHGDEPLNFLDSFAALDLDEAPEPEMPLSEVEVDDWETPVEFSPAERLAQSAGETYVPSLDDFDQDDIGDLLGDDDLDDIFEDSDDVSSVDDAPPEPALAEKDEAEDAEVEELSAPVLADMEDDESFDAGLFDGDLTEETIEFAPESVAEQVAVDSPSAEIDDGLDLEIDELHGLLGDEGEEFFDDADLEDSDEATAIEDKELRFDAADLEGLAESADVPAENLAIATDVEIDSPAAEIDDGLDLEIDELHGLLGDEGEEFFDDADLEDSDEATAIEDKELRFDAADLEGLAESADVPAENLAIAADVDDSLGDLLGEEDTTEAPDLPVPEESVSEAIASDAEIEQEATQSAEEYIPDEELLQFLGQDWQSHPGVSEISSLDEELESELASNHGEPAILQPLTEEELADLEGVEDTDWFASSLDNDWPPLKAGDTDTLSGIDLSSDFVEDHGESGGTGQLESPQTDDDFGAVGALDSSIAEGWESVDDFGTGGVGVVDDDAFALLGFELNPTAVEADFDAMDVPPDDETMGDLDGSEMDDVGVLGDSEGEAIAAVDPEPAITAEEDQSDFTTLPDPFAEDADDWLDEDNNDPDDEVDLALNPEDSMAMDLDENLLDEAESLDLADSDDSAALLDPFAAADWSEDDDALDDLDGLELPALNDAGINFADGGMSAEMQLDELDADMEDEDFSDPLADLDEDTALDDLDLGDIGDLENNFDDNDISADAELADPFADLGEDDDVFDDVGDLDLGNLDGGAGDFDDSDISAEMQLDGLDTDVEDEDFSDPLADLDEDTALDDLDLGNIGDLENNFADSDISADAELADPFADLEEDDDAFDDVGDLDLGNLEGDDGGDLDLGNLDGGAGDFADSDISTDAELADPFADLGEDDDAFDNLGDLDLGNVGDLENDFADNDISIDAENEGLSESFADLEENDELFNDAGDLGLGNLDDVDSDFADGDMSMAGMQLDSLDMDTGDDDLSADPFANLDDLDLGEEEDSLGDLGDLDSADLDDMTDDDALADMGDDDLSMGSLGSLELPDMGDADEDMEDGDDDFLSAEVLDSIKDLDASTAELGLSNPEDNSVLGVMDSLAAFEESSLEDADLLSFEDTDDELDFESLALESELELTELSDTDDGNGAANFSLDDMDSDLAFDELAIAADDADGENTEGSWNDLDLGDSEDFSLPDLEEDSNASIDLDFDRGFTDEEESLPAIALETDKSGDWQDLDQPATATHGPASDNADWDALQNTVVHDSKSTSGQEFDNWAIANLEGLNDLGDADLGKLGNFDLDSLESDESNEDFDLFGSDDDTDSFNRLFESET